MGGLGFIHLGFLAASAAVAVPIVIHLLFRQRARRVEIGTIHFLRVVLQDQARRRKIRRWLLLALRAAGVLLLALLFARPFWRAPETLGSEREVVILIDRSASMAAGVAGATPFDKAQRQATKLIAGLPSGSTVRLAYFDADDVAPAPESKIDLAMRPALAGTDYTRALGWARDIIVASRRLKREVFLLTDLQRSGIGPPLADGFPAGTAIELVDVGRPLTTNLAIEEITAEQTELKGGKPPVIAARVYNAGVFPARDLHVSLSLNGKPAVEKTVSIDGRSRQLVRFEAPVNEPGMYQGFVEVAAHDDLPFDDRRWLAFQARRPDRVLLIDGQPGPSVFGNETYYLETALRLRLPGDESAESPSPYEPTRVAWSGPGGSLPDLGPFHVVALCNVPDVSDDDATALARFVVAGGNLIIFTGDQVEAGAYAALSRAGVLPAELQGPADIGSYRFNEWDQNHPILSPFTDPQYGDSAHSSVSENHATETRSAGPGTRLGAWGRTIDRRENGGTRTIHPLRVSGRHWRGRLGKSSPLSPADPSIARLPDRTAAGNTPGQKQSRRPNAGAGTRRHDEQWASNRPKRRPRRVRDRTHDGGAASRELPAPRGRQNDRTR